VVGPTANPTVSDATPTMSETSWYEDAFRAHYLRVYPHRDLEAARPEARWLIERGVAGRTLDLCCGFGRHTLLLAEAGVDVFGLDLSRDLLLQSRALPGAERHLAGRLVRADAREIPFASAAFQTVVNLFSSFGYFGELGDARVLREIARVLQPRGLAVLDLMNPPFVRAGLRAETLREGPDFLLRERRSLEDGGRRVVKEVELRSEEEVRRWREDVRLYELGEFRSLARDVGLELLDVCGGFDSSAHTATSSRMLVRLRRA
jgi:SAM-dependent methyltransferase